MNKYEDFSDNKQETRDYHEAIISMMRVKIKDIENEVNNMKDTPIRYGRMIEVLKRQIKRFEREIKIKEGELAEYERRGFI